jgi:hypothetical protein
LTTVQAQWLTLAFVAGVTVLVVGFDVWVTLRFGPDASISRVFARLFGRCPTAAAAAVFWLGVLVGHIWLPSH